MMLARPGESRLKARVGVLGGEPARTPVGRTLEFMGRRIGPSPVRRESS